MANFKALIGCIAAGTVLAFLADVLNVISAPRHSWAIFRWWDLLKLPGELVAGGTEGTPNMIVG
jgi:hypothetical protein